ncbi:hypothetical protein BZL30_4078 [Mycobacterium kansasii]|uniref:Uncharacterized protein n=1 Tax=Mycobacterium kansasii TaxID=1768 RepID=A0A1V3XC50_MYCKA|nr:hypothetical protein BZL30_4078 [Mycobacterium kansasii]
MQVELRTHRILMCQRGFRSCDRIGGRCLTAIRRCGCRFTPLRAITRPCHAA